MYYNTRLYTNSVDVSADAVCTNLPQVLRHTLDLFSKQAVRSIPGSSRALVQSRHQQSSGSLSASPSRAASSTTSTSSARTTSTAPTRVLGAHEHEVALASLVRRTALLRLLERLLALAAKQLSRDGDRTRARAASGHTDAEADADADADSEADPRTWLTVRFDDSLSPPACGRVHSAVERAASSPALTAFTRFVIDSSVAVRVQEFQFSQSVDYPIGMNVVDL